MGYLFSELKSLYPAYVDFMGLLQLVVNFCNFYVQEEHLGCLLIIFLFFRPRQKLYMKIGLFLEMIRLRR